MILLIRRLLVEEDAQDLAEYALLAFFIGLAGLAVWGVVRTTFGPYYAALDAAEQDLWEPPNP